MDDLDISDTTIDRRGDYQQIIARDPVQPAEDMRRDSRADLGTTGIPREEYIDPAFHRLEVERMWSRVWQFACREEEIPETGDVLPYQIADRSVLLVRSAPDTIKAFPNSCPHRGTKFCAVQTSVEQLRCPFHGFTWSLDGRLSFVPARWDFPHIEDDAYQLPELRVGRWAGFVFISFDPEAPPLETYLGHLPAELAGTELERQYIAGHYVKILPANWKACLEAFVEAYHIAETHAHASLISDEFATQYDCAPDQPHVSRFLQPLVIHSTRRPDWTEQDLLDEMFRLIEAGTAPRLPEGTTARAFVAQMRRDQLARDSGRDFSRLPDAEAVDTLEYLVFPNTILFRGYGVPAIYRFRPNGNDPDSCVFDLYVIQPAPAEGPRPPAAEPVELGSRSFAEAHPLPAWLGYLYDQDTQNLGLQQEGLKSSFRPELTLSRYQEIRIRHLHETLHRYVDRPVTTS